MCLIVFITFVLAPFLLNVWYLGRILYCHFSLKGFFLFILIPLYIKLH